MFQHHYHSVLPNQKEHLSGRNGATYTDNHSSNGLEDQNIPLYKPYQHSQLCLVPGSTYLCPLYGNASKYDTTCSPPFEQYGESQNYPLLYDPSKQTHCSYDWSVGRDASSSSSGRQSRPAQYSNMTSGQGSIRETKLQNQSPLCPKESYRPPVRPAVHPAKDERLQSLLPKGATSRTASYQLRGILGYITEFSCHQRGSRYIQQQLEIGTSDEKRLIFLEIEPNTLQLATDIFGNYVIQKLLEHGSEGQKRALLKQMKNHIVELSIQVYGCRVIQKALEYVHASQQAEISQELNADIYRCVKDRNGNYVIQQAIKSCLPEHIRFIIEACRGQTHTLATHPYGCRVIQRILEYYRPSEISTILEELHTYSSSLIIDQYGNYVMQHILRYGQTADQEKIIENLISNILPYSKSKFASNLVEKGIEYSTTRQKKVIVARLTSLYSDGSSPLQLIIKDRYGYYVIQKLLSELRGVERKAFIDQIRRQLLTLETQKCSRQTVAIEELIFLSGVTVKRGGNFSSRCDLEDKAFQPSGDI